MTPILSSTLLRTQADSRLVAMAGEGSERAFEAIVERYRRPLLRYCRRILPEGRAEDAVQQTWLKAWSALSDGLDVSDLKPWLYRIAFTTSLDAARRSGYDFDELDDSLSLSPGADEDLERRAVMRETLAGLAALPENQREALLRTAVEGDSRADIARDLGVTDGAVRQLVHRARANLRAAMTAVTPLPFATWVAGTGSAGAPTAERIAELAVVAGSASFAGMALKTGGAVVAAGVIAAGATGELGKVAGAGDQPPAAASTVTTATTAARTAVAGARTAGRTGVAPSGAGDGRSGPGGGDDSSGSGSGGDGDSSGPGSGGDDSGTSGGDSDSSGPGSGDSGSTGSGSSGSGTSGSGSSGSGSSGSGSSGSGADGSGSGSSGSGSSGSGSGDDALIP